MPAEVRQPRSSGRPASGIFADIAPVKYDNAKIVTSIFLFYGQIHQKLATLSLNYKGVARVKSALLREIEQNTISKREEKNNVLLLESKIKPAPSLHDGRGV